MRTMLAVLIPLVLAAPAPAVDRAQWLHIAVDGTGSDPERVRVNVPLSLVEVVLPLVETRELHDGKVRIDGHELARQDIAKILEALRDAEDGLYVTVEDAGETVRIAKEGKHVTVRFEETPGEKGEVRVPVAVLDALVSGEDGELDLLAAVRALGEHEAETLVTVEETDATVRIWIDRKNESD